MDINIVTDYFRHLFHYIEIYNGIIDAVKSVLTIATLIGLGKILKKDNLKILHLQG